MNQESQHPMAEILADIEERTIHPGEKIEGRVLQVDDRDVFLDIGIKSEGTVPLAEFTTKPAIDSRVTVIVKKLPTGPNTNAILSKRDADDLIHWAYLQEAFDQGIPLYGIVEKSDRNGKGFLVAVDWESTEIADGADINHIKGRPCFLPMSQVGKKDTQGKSLVGQKISFKIIELNEKTRSAVISQKILQDEQNEIAWTEFMSSCSEGDTVKATVRKIVSFGIFLETHGLTGLLHSSDISWKKPGKFSKMFNVGEEIDVKILKVEQELGRVSFGLKQLTEDPWVTASVSLQQGQVVNGVIRSVTRYGAFMELEGYEGVEGLIHKTEISWTKKQVSPKDVLKPGQPASAQVLDLDFDSRRIALGMKQVLPNPWDSIDETVKVGDVLKAKVSSVTKFGAFVPVAEDIDGLIHISDMSWEDNVKSPRDVVKKGEEVEFKVLEINKEEQRISCGIKQLAENPYNQLKKKYPRGATLEVTITRFTNAGIVVQVDEKYEGFVALPNITRRRIDSVDEVKEDFKVGQKVGVSVIKIIPAQKKIALSIKDFERSQEKKSMQPYLSDGKPGTYNPFADLIDE